MRWACATWALTVVVCSLYDLFLWGSLPALGEVIMFHLAIVVIGCGTSLIAVLLLSRVPYLVPAIVVTAAAGFVLSYARATITYGTGSEALDGLMFRAFGGALVGLVSACIAWSLQRWARRPASPASPATPRM